MVAAVNPKLVPIDRRIRLAYEAAQTVRSRTRWDVRQWANWSRGDTSYVNFVYVVLLNFPKHDDPFGLYVGCSHLPPRDRLRNHRAGVMANEDVRRHGVRLLQRVYQHLNPMRPSEGPHVERALYQALRAADIGWVSMGELRPTPNHQ